MGPTLEPGVLAANVVRFGRLLRSAGLPVEPGQVRSFLRGMALVGPGQRADVKAAGRTIFARSREQAAVFDAAFDLFWRRSTVHGHLSPDMPRLSLRRVEPSPDERSAGDGGDTGRVVDVVDASTRGPSARESLRTSDFAELSRVEQQDAEAMLDALVPRLARRPSRRPRVGRRGRRLAARAMLRWSLGAGGEALDWRWLRRTTRPRPLVLIGDISGSMADYTRFLIRFAHALGRAGAPLEVFVFGTRLTRITRELRMRRANDALARVAHRVVDWHGGTRIGESLHELNRRWVRRTVRSGAIVLLVSDGWERGDPALLATEMAALRRACHRLIWLNPLVSRAGFEPATVGLRAALPFVDALLPCASVASLEALAGQLRDLERPRLQPSGLDRGGP